MKRTLFTVALISFVLVLGLTVFSCGGGGSGPSAVVKQYYAAMEKGNFKAAVALMEPDMAALIEALLDDDDIKEAMAEAKEEASTKGAIVSTEEEIDDDKATVTVTYKDGSTETHKLKKIDGKWKISMGK
jgi:ketosteroid isomerase-like protein